MSRINVYREDMYGEETILEGWFDPETTERFKEDTEWNGSNFVGVITGAQWEHEELYRTKGGRWVRSRWSQREGSSPQYWFLSEAEAHDWLLRSECNDEAIEQYFGDIEEERGPGRPEIGSPVQIRFPQELLDRVDARAAEEGVKRAEMVRRLVANAL